LSLIIYFCRFFMGDKFTNMYLKKKNIYIYIYFCDNFKLCLPETNSMDQSPF
jgi:hypothetical protein